MFSCLCQSAIPEVIEGHHLLLCGLRGANEGHGLLLGEAGVALKHLTEPLGKLVKRDLALEGVRDVVIELGVDTVKGAAADRVHHNLVGCL